MLNSACETKVKISKYDHLISHLADKSEISGNKKSELNCHGGEEMYTMRSNEL